MSAYIVRRLLILPIILWGLTLLIFLMISMLSPYERVALYVSDTSKREGAIEEVIHKYGLDKPIYVQYFEWLKRTAQGNLGFSKVGKQPVAAALRQYVPVTAELAIWSFIPMVTIGIWMGVQAAVHQDRWIDHLARIFSITGWSIPLFVFGLIMLMIFYARLDWFPAGRLSNWASAIVQSEGFHRYTNMNTFDALLNARLDIFVDALRHLVLPVVTLSYLNWALILRVTRSAMLETLRQDYVTTARAKGLAERVVIGKHARPNAMISVVTVAGLTLVTLLNGAVLTETIFNLHGIGWFLAAAASNLDVISVLGVSLFSGVIMVTGNLVVDILYGVIDPRVRIS
jgi:peptide/nickel transport system permease protein